MKELGVYPGSFRPFHRDHLARVETILTAYPNQDLIIAVADQCRSPKKYDFICGTDALETTSLVIDSERLGNRVRVQLATIDSKIPPGVCRIFTGSERTIKVLELLRERGAWKGEIVRLDNSGIHGEQIRKLISEGDPYWKEFVHPVAVSYIEGLKG